MKKTETVAVIGVLAAFGAILSYIEAILSFSIGVPGIKLGLANIVVVIALYRYGAKEAAIVNAVRIVVVGLLFSNVFSIVFSLCGAIFSLIFMILIKRFDKFSILGVSTVGGVAHNIGQILIAMVIVDSYSVVYYVPVLFMAGIITGIIIGLIGNIILYYIPKKI